MKLNWSFSIKTALTITLLTSATIFANAREVTNYAQDHSSESQDKVTATLAADSAKSDYRTISKHTTEIKFTFAIVFIILGLIASAKYQN